MHGFPSGPASPRPSPAQRGCGEAGTNLWHEALGRVSVHVSGIGSKLLLSLALGVAAWAPSSAQARPNTHGPAISTWDPRASSVVLGVTRAVSGSGGYSALSYNANFSSTNGILSAQFGVHYLTYQNAEGAPVARGASAGGVALISLPLASRFENGVPRSSFAFYIGGVPTALYAGEINFISVPLVLGIGVPFSPTPFITLRPWLELSPGLNFDTRINVDAVSTQDAIQSAMDGTLTEDEVRGLVEQGLEIESATTLGKRAGLSVAAHLGKRVDLDLNLMLGAGRPSALSFGAALVVRWDTLVHELERDKSGHAAAEESCAAIAARYHRSCSAERPRTGPARRRPAKNPAPDPRRRTPQTPASPGSVAPVVTETAPPPAPRPSPPSATPVEPGSAAARPAAKKPASSPPSLPAPAPLAPKTNELPPLQAAPPLLP
jgi:hypothetical protein